jgi:hypothetical protein
MLTKLLAVFIVLVCQPGAGSAFLPISNTQSFVSQQLAPHTSLQASLKPLLASFFSTVTRTRKNSTDVGEDQVREDNQDDFLLVMPKPAILNHGRCKQRKIPIIR